MSNLVDRLSKELDTRGWSMRELSRRSAGVSDSLISLVLSEQARATADFCVKIADALNWDKEDTLRLAGILDPLPPEVQEEKELVKRFRELDPQLRIAVLQMVRSLQDIRTVPAPVASILDVPTLLWAILEHLSPTEQDDLHRRLTVRLAEPTEETATIDKG